MLKGRTLARWDQASGEVTPTIQGCRRAAGAGAPSPGLGCRRHSGSGVPARAPGLRERPAAADPEPGRLSTAGAIAVGAAREPLSPARLPHTCRCSCSYRRRCRPSPVLRGASSQPLLNGAGWSARPDQSKGYVSAPGQPSAEPSMGAPPSVRSRSCRAAAASQDVGGLNVQQLNQPCFTDG